MEVKSKVTKLVEKSEEVKRKAQDLRDRLRGDVDDTRENSGISEESKK